MARETVIFETPSALAMSARVVCIYFALFLFERARDGRFGQRRHDLISLLIWVQTIVAQLISQKTFVVNHR